MQLTADIFLALRYLRPKRTFISLITLLSILGPILGVALLVIVTAVMAGFDRDIREGILGMQSHVQVTPAFRLTSDRPAMFEDPEPVMAALHRAGAKGSPLIEGAVLVQLRGQAMPKFVKGIMPATEREVTSIARTKGFVGRFDIAEGEALIGSGMAAQLGLALGDRLLIHSPSRLTRNVQWSEDGRVQMGEVDEVYLPEEVTIVGIFSMGVYEYDSSIVFVHLDQAADLFGMEWGSATSVHASVPDPFDLDEIVVALGEDLPQCRIVTWQQANRQLFGALQVEKNLMSFLLFFIVIVASFGIAGTLITVVVQKTREIGVLKAVGMSRGMVARIFLLQGATIGVLGTVLGTTIGLLVIRYRERVAALLAKIMGHEIFPQELYHLSQIPALSKRSDVLAIVSLAFFVCVLASLVPALYASHLSPAQALQEEN